MFSLICLLFQASPLCSCLRMYSIPALRVLFWVALQTSQRFVQLKNLSGNSWAYNLCSYNSQLLDQCNVRVFMLFRPPSPDVAPKHAHYRTTHTPCIVA